jgi:hypothetical protein
MVAVPSVSETPPAEVLPTAVTVIGPLVVPIQVASPLVESAAELIFTFTASETVHCGVSLAMIAGEAADDTAGTAQPACAAGEAVAMNCSSSPGATAMWSAVAVAGETAVTSIVEQADCDVEQPARRLMSRSSATAKRGALMRRSVSKSYRRRREKLKPTSAAENPTG